MPWRRRPAPEAEPDLGAKGAAFPLWRAREVLTQAEKRLASTSATLAVHEARATAMLGWLSAETLAVIALLATHRTLHWEIVGAAFLLVAGLSAFWIVRVFKPKNWIVVGHDVTWLRKQQDDPCELYILESMGGVYADGIASNEATLDEVLLYLRRAWRMFIAAPIVMALSAAAVMVALSVS